MPRLRVSFSLLLLLSLAFCSKKEAPEASAPSVGVAPTSASASPAPAPAATATTATTATTAPAAAAPATAGIASSDGETPGVTITVKELKRASGGTVSLKMVLANGSDKDVGSGYTFVDPDNTDKDYNSIGGVQLIDPVGKKKYFVARDSGGKCVCSSDLKVIRPGTSVNLWAKLPAPPADVKKISVVIPHFQPMDDVPIGE